MTFSERIGVVPIRKALQLDSMTVELRNCLWNALYETYWLPGRGVSTLMRESAPGGAAAGIWTTVLKQPRDRLNAYVSDAVQQIRGIFFSAPWNLVYDVLDYVANYRDPNLHNKLNEFVAYCNVVLQREGSGYRFVGRLLVPITEEHEIQSIEAAVKSPDRFAPAAMHVKAAISHLANRESPDYRNSIKESISAVEAACKIITGDDNATLGAAIKQLRSNGVDMHPAFEGALSKMYGYTNDAEGIRHALLSESSLDASDATFMLVMCSAFVNYLKAKSAGKPSRS